MFAETHYKKIDGSNFNKIYVCGDIHGQYDKLMNSLKELNFNFETDLLISVGDLVDRGNGSFKVLQLIEENWFDCVLGNHESMAYNGLRDRFDEAFWRKYGGDWFFELTQEEQNLAFYLIDKISSTKPLVLEVNTTDKRKHVICHADYPFDRYVYNKLLSKDDIETLLWSRDRIDSGNNSIIIGADSFYFGHSILKEPVKLGNCNFIDTGSFLLDGYITFVRIQ